MLMVALPLAGCVIIVQEPPPMNTTPVPALTCIDAATMNAPTAHLIFDVRIERTTANLEADYASWLQTTAFALGTAHILTTEGALVRLDERPVPEKVRLLAAWGCNLDDPSQLQPEAVLHHYALNADLDPSPLGCATDPLTWIGANLPVVTDYPPDLPGTSGRKAFAEAPSVAIIVHIDNRPRRTAFTDPACDGAKHFFDKTDQGMSGWLAYPSGGISADHVVHWFINTEEMIDRDTFVASCEKNDGFPTSVLDELDPSPNALYGPLMSGIDSAGAGKVSGISMCAMLTSGGMSKFIHDRVHDVADIVGTSVNEATLKEVLMSGGLRLPGGAGSGSTPPPSSTPGSG
jgi:hypothetical protein